MLATRRRDIAAIAYGFMASKALFCSAVGRPTIIVRSSSLR